MLDVCLHEAGRMSAGGRKIVEEGKLVRRRKFAAAGMQEDATQCNSGRGKFALPRGRKGMAGKGGEEKGECNTPEWAG